MPSAWQEQFCGIDKNMNGHTLNYAGHYDN